MFIAFMSLVIIASAPLLGGRLALLAAIRLKHTALIIAALFVQVLITEVIPRAPRPLDVGLHLATYVAAGFALWANRRLPGLLVIAAGALSNGAVIALNGGTLPASKAALLRAGYSLSESKFKNSGVLPHPVLPWLGDVFTTPAWLPFRNVLSVGDVVILVGTAVLVHTVSRSSLARRPFARRAPSPAG